MNGAYRSDGTTLAFRDSGAGIPVIFLHPTPLDRDYWRPLAEQLAGVRAIIPDFRGHGSSELGANLPFGAFAEAPDAIVLTIPQLATDILALMDHLQISEAVFAGCSIGGYVLLELWRIAPRRITALAFVCSKPQPDSEAARAKRAANIAQIRAEGTATLFETMAHSLIGKTAQDRHPGMLAELLSRMTLSAEAAIAVQAGLALRPDSLSTIPTIDAPILAIAGGEDPAVTPAEMDAFTTAPGGCEFHLLPDAGHFAAYEQPQKVASLLSEWLRQPRA